MARQPLKTGGFLWGARRVKAEISLNELATEAGVAKGNISMMENGRLNPTSDEHQKIMAALERLEAAKKEAAAAATA